MHKIGLIRVNVKTLSGVFFKKFNFVTLGISTSFSFDDSKLDTKMAAFLGIRTDKKFEYRGIHNAKINLCSPADRPL